MLPTELAFPIDCRGLCRNRYRNNALKKLRKNYERFTSTIDFTIIGSRAVTLVFCGIFDSGNSLLIYLPLKKEIFVDISSRLCWLHITISKLCLSDGFE